MIILSAAAFYRIFLKKLSKYVNRLMHEPRKFQKMVFAIVDLTLLTSHLNSLWQVQVNFH